MLKCVEQFINLLFNRKSILIFNKKNYEKNVLYVWIMLNVLI